MDCHGNSGPLPYEKALTIWLNALDKLGVVGNSATLPKECVYTAESQSRVTAAPVFAQTSSPQYLSALINGVALRSKDTGTASPDNPVVLEFGKDCIFADVGSPLLNGLDCVCHCSNIASIDAHSVTVTRSFDPWSNVRPVGEDITAQEIILPVGHWISSLDMGALLSGGVTKLEVYKKPKVAIVALGNNLVPPTVPALEGEVVDSITPILTGSLRQLGAEPCPIGIYKETAQSLSKVAHVAKNHDLIVIAAGPSRGTNLVADFLKLKGTLLIHNVAIKPGSSVTLGFLGNCPVVCVSFYPVSAYLVCDLFVKPLVQMRLGGSRFQDVVEWARLATDIVSPKGMEEFPRVRMGLVRGNRAAVPVSRGATLLMNLVRADGLVRVAASQEKIEAGTPIAVRRFSPLRPLDNSVIVIGTHDICHDILQKFCFLNYPDLKLIWTKGKSIGGVEKLKQGLCHVAAVHIFDAKTGIFNIPYMERYWDDGKAKLYNLFTRPIGLGVKPGNPKNILGIEDLVRNDVRFINRQIGSGTRTLIDYHLGKANVPIDKIEGYSNVTRNPLSAAAAVASSIADAAFVMPAAAKALNLDFIPCFTEQMDFLVPETSANYYPVQQLLNVISLESFRAEASLSLSHYDFSKSGSVVWEK